jgi:hypothetical protein
MKAVALTRDGDVRWWDLRSPARGRMATDAGRPRWITLSADGAFVGVWGGRRFQVLAIDDSRRRGFASDGDASAATFTADSSLVVRCAGDIETASLDGVPRSSFPGLASAIAAHPRAPLLALIRDRVVEVRDRGTGECRAALVLGGRAQDVVWLTSGTGLAVAGEGGVYVLDLLGMPEPT